MYSAKVDEPIVSWFGGRLTLGPRNRITPEGVDCRQITLDEDASHSLATRAFVQSRNVLNC